MVFEAGSETAEKCLEEQGTELANGLCTVEVAARRSKHGANKACGVGTAPLSSFRELFLALLDTPVVQCTLTAILASFFATLFAGGTVQWRELLGGALLVCIPAVISHIHEKRALHWMATQSTLTYPKVAVRREGKVRSVPSIELVPGDIVLCNAGDLVAADMRLVETTANLQVTQKFLTGERTAAKKCVDPVPGADIFPTMLYSGSTVVSGSGVCVVVATGAATEESKKRETDGTCSDPLAVHLLRGLFHSCSSDGDTSYKTAFRTQRVSQGGRVYSGGCFHIERDLAKFSEAASKIVLTICTAVWVLHLSDFSSLLGFVGSLQTSVCLYAVTVGWLPFVEGIGFLGVNFARRILERSEEHCLVKRPQCIEKLGAVEAVCTDLSGVFTEGVVVARAVRTFHSETQFKKYYVKGTSYNPLDRAHWAPGSDSCVDPSTVICDEDGNRPVSNPLEHNEALADVALTSAMCTTAVLRYSVEQRKCVKDSPPGRPSPFLSSDTALLTLVEKLGSTSHSKNMELLLLIDPEKRVSACRKIWEAAHTPTASVDYTAERRCGAAVLKTKNGSVLVAKGAVGVLLPRCTSIKLGDGTTTPLTEEVRRMVVEEVGALERQGMAVLATARRDVDDSVATEADVLKEEQALTLTGLVGLSDTPLPEVASHKGADEPLIVVVTDEDRTTALATAVRVGIFQGKVDATLLENVETSSQLFTAQAFEHLSAAERIDEIYNIKVICRATASTKLRVIDALQGRGLSTCVIGSSLSDIEAMQKADVSVAAPDAVNAVRREGDVTMLAQGYPTLSAAFQQGRAFARAGNAYRRNNVTASVTLLVFTFAASWAPLPRLTSAFHLLLLGTLFKVGTLTQPPASSVFCQKSNDVMKSAAVGFLLALGCLVVVSQLGLEEGRAEAFCLCAMVAVGLDVFGGIDAFVPLAEEQGVRTARPASGALFHVPLMVLFSLVTATYLPVISSLLGVSGLYNSDIVLIAVLAVFGYLVRRVVFIYGDKVVDFAEAATAAKKKQSPKSQ